jgi:hypothetical protein
MYPVVAGVFRQIAVAVGKRSVISQSALFFGRQAGEGLVALPDGGIVEY